MKLGYALAMTVMMAMATAGACAAPAEKIPKRPVMHVMFDYMVEDHQKSAADDRTAITQASMRGEGSLSFSHYEFVEGATTPVVHEAKLWSSDEAEPTPAQQEALIKALTDAGIFSLQSNGTTARSEYDARLDIRIGTREASFTFSTPPEGTQLTVHKVLLDFVHQFGLDQPKPGEERVSEGDKVPAQAVELTELIAHPDVYNGKRVRTVGYYHGQFEGETFCVDKWSVTKNRYDKCIWYGEASTFADEADIDSGNDRWETIDGVFFKGPGDHMGLWPGEMARLTRIKPLVPAVKSK